MIDDLAYSLKRVLHGPRQKAPQTMAGDFKYSCYISWQDFSQAESGRRFSVCVVSAVCEWES